MRSVKIVKESNIDLLEGKINDVLTSNVKRELFDIKIQTIDNNTIVAIIIFNN
ncbi:hypothetical protein ACT8ZR_18265 [Neobacillus sp. M.A.Huq-85]